MNDDNFGLGFGKSILLGIGVGIIMPIVFWFVFRISSAKEREYLEKGVLTPCFVETILSISGKQQVWVAYQKPDGTVVKAKAVLNKHVGVGETVKAYVLESDPGNVYYPPAPFLKWIIFIMIVAAALASWIPLIMEFHHRRFIRMVNQTKAMNQRKSE